MDILCLIIGIFIGCFVGFVICTLGFYGFLCGTLKTTYDNGEQYLFLDMDEYPEKMMRRKYALFKVDNSDMLSQK
jgi:hypothetical protein